MVLPGLVLQQPELSGCCAELQVRMLALHLGAVPCSTAPLPPLLTTLVRWAHPSTSVLRLPTAGRSMMKR